MDSLVIAVIAVFAILILYMIWAARAAPSYVGDTPGGTPVYAADTPVAGIVVPAAPEPTYTFHQGYGTNSDNIEIRREDAGKIDKLKEACNAIAECVGFTTKGALKSNVDKIKWVKRNKSDPAFGLYVRD